MKINEVAGTSTSNEAILVNGITVADALSASNDSAINSVPIYLASKTKLPIDLPDTIDKVLIYGGHGAISQEVEDQLTSSGIKVYRISGENRFETNIRAIQNEDRDTVLLVRGTSTSSKKEDYPDAVAVSGLAHKLNASILLSHPTKPIDEIEQLLEWKDFKNIYVLGGKGAVSTYVADQLTTMEPKPAINIPANTITLGSTMEDIRALMPNGRLTSSDSYKYGSSYIYLENTPEAFKVTGWDDNGDLKVSVGESYPDAQAITLGSSKEDVVRAMGTPHYIHPVFHSWAYEMGSYVYFDNQYNVKGFSNKGNLKVQMGVKVSSAPPFTIGSSKADVLSAMGTPDSISNANKAYWSYGESRVYFSEYEGHVESFTNKGELKIDKEEPDKDAPPVTLGSSEEEIIRAMGAPDEVLRGLHFSISWRYSSSYLGVDRYGKVIGWVDEGDLNVSMGEKVPGAEPITIGSTKTELIRAMGTPDELYYNNWSYGKSMVSVNMYDEITYLSNDGGNLKVSNQEQVEGAPPFRLGSTREDVTKVMGGPDSIYINEILNEKFFSWKYGDSSIHFTEDHKVVHWSNKGNLQVHLGDPDSNADPFHIGSTKEEVINVMGTPRYIIKTVMGRIVWAYGDSFIEFDDEYKVISFEDNGELKVD